MSGPGGTATRDATERRILLAGALAALLIGVGYVVIIGLYASVGAPPTDGAAWLDYIPGKTATWWGIIALSVVTDLLFLPVAFAISRVLQGVDRDLLLGGVAGIALFVVLDLAVTWPTYAGLVAIGEQVAGLQDQAAREAYMPTATYARSILASTLEGLYAIGTLSFGLLLVGVVMLRARRFGRATAWVAILTGVSGLASVVGGAVAAALGNLVILSSLLTTVWAFLVAWDLWRLRRSGR